MSVLHVWHSSEWRGAENQFRLLTTHLDEPWRGRLMAPAGSELARRLDGVLPFHAARCGGYFDLPSMLMLRRLVREHGIRLIHAHDSHAHSMAALARKGLGIKLVASRRNAFPASGSWKYRTTDAFLAVSSAAADVLVDAGVPRASIDVMLAAVDTAGLAAAKPERLGIPEEDVLVLCIAALSAEKDHETLLRAWSIVEPAAPQATLALAGEGGLRSSLEGMAAGLGLQRVRFLGWRNDIANLIRGADIVTLSSRAEGLGSSLCEAQAAARPVVATNAGGIGEAIEDGRTGLLSPVGDLQAFANNLLALIEHPQRRRIMGAAGAERAARLFSPESIARKHEEVYRRVLAS